MIQKEKSWLVVEFEVGLEQEDLAAWLMMQCGSRGCEILPAGNSAVTIQATFDRNETVEPDITGLQSSLELYGLASALKSLRLKIIPEEDWLAEWKKGFEPFPVGNKFLITPPWSQDKLTPEEMAGRHVIVIEPGMAFGTGTHITTQYCLREIERHNLGTQIIDVGTGSGILAIASALVAPQSSIIGIDIDGDALRIARENLELNQVCRQVELIEGSTEVLDNQSCDCILSNLTCEDIVALLLEYLRLLRPEGIVICAGILAEKLPLLKQAIETYPLAILNEESSQTWAGVTLRRIGVVVAPA